MNDRLTTKEYWNWSRPWQKMSLPVIAEPRYDIYKTLDNILPKSNKMSFMEIGCAPGGWMAYFNKHFGYAVSGIEYVAEAVAVTKRNMEIQRICADVLSHDFLEVEITPGSYDVVFSIGFVEHFQNLYSVVNKISILAKQYVVTLVPNLYGVNGFISKHVRPKVFYAHKRIDTDLLRRLHEDSGLTTLFCDYVGGIQFIMPAAGIPLFDKNRRLANIVNLPFRVFNRISRTFSKFANIHPGTKLFSNSLLYIGEKCPDNSTVHLPMS